MVLLLLEYVQIFTAFRFGYVGETDFVQNFLGNVQRHLGARIAQIGGAGPLLTLLLQSNLIQKVTRHKKKYVNVQTNWYWPKWPTNADREK